MTFGFIITRHVTSEITNQYWNECIRCIRKYYPFITTKIVVIDDNSDQQFVSATYEYKNVIYVQSEFPGRGELLPYYYFYKNHYFDKAVIIHDSVFIQTKINFNKINLPVLPLWHFENEKKENLHNSLRIVNVLKNNYKIQEMLHDKNKYEILSFNNQNWYGCFGVQCMIHYDFLNSLQTKYGVFNMLTNIQCRPDRCCLERIMGILFALEYPLLNKFPSLLGNISTYCPWGRTYQDHCNEIKERKRSKYPVVKVWTGR
jgi:hypothetical protein